MTIFSGGFFLAWLELEGGRPPPANEICTPDSYASGATAMTNEAPPSPAEKALALKVLCDEMGGGTLRGKVTAGNLRGTELQEAMLLGAATSIGKVLAVEQGRALTILDTALREQMEKQGRETPNITIACEPR